MKIAIVGTGYVGLVTGTCFAESGFNVTCIDIDQKKIELLEKGQSPIYEPGLELLLNRNIQKRRLSFSTSLPNIIKDTDIVFSAVGTPPDEDGGADLRHVLDVARIIGRHMEKHLLIVTKSTVPVGTAQLIKATIQEELDLRKVHIDFDVASNPEFLKEGDAINDFMRPERIVVGVESPKAEALLRKIYKPFVLNGHPIIVTDIASAEMIKYAANAMLATRISFMNDIANLCERVGADVDMVRKGIGSDSRIGSKFLYAGAGYGGSCFPKDIKALLKTAEQNGYPLELLKAVELINNRQKTVLFNKLQDFFKGELAGKQIAILGLAFKPNTDNMRESTALVLIEHLLNAQCKIKVYDPVAMEECHRRIGNSVAYCTNIYETLHQADAMLLITEWNEFRTLDFDMAKKIMTTPVIFDGRNIYDGNEIRKNGFIYFGIGKPSHIQTNDTLLPKKNK